MGPPSAAGVSTPRAVEVWGVRRRSAGEQSGSKGEAGLGKAEVERGRGGRTGRLLKRNCPSSHGNELPGLADAQPDKLAFKVPP